MTKYIVFVVLAFVLTSCTTSTKLIKVKDELTGKSKEVYIIEEIEVKLMNDYKEIYNIEDVIIAYGTNSFNPFEGRIISDEFKSTNKIFNSIYTNFSKNGLEKDIFENEYMTFTDDAILGILAKEYGMKIVILNKSNNKIEELDYKNRNISFSKREKSRIYNAFEKTIKHYKEQTEAK